MAFLLMTSVRILMSKGRLIEKVQLNFGRAINYVRQTEAKFFGHHRGESHPITSGNAEAQTKGSISDWPAM